MTNRTPARSAPRGIWLWPSALSLLSACATVPDRAAASSFGCMATVRDSLPIGVSDRRAHCLAAGEIARRCSVLEADMAALGKELRDLFGGGDASWADWRADRVGIRCAKQENSEQGVEACCAAAEY